MVAFSDVFVFMFVIFSVFLLVMSEPQTHKVDIILVASQ